MAKDFHSLAIAFMFFVNCWPSLAQYYLAYPNTVESTYAKDMQQTPIRYNCIFLLVWFVRRWFHFTIQVYIKLFSTQRSFLPRPFFGLAILLWFILHNHTWLSFLYDFFLTHTHTHQHNHICKLRARLVYVFKNWKLLFENICENMCGWKNTLKCVKYCLKIENDCLKTQTKELLTACFGCGDV